MQLTRPAGSVSTALAKVFTPEAPEEVAEMLKLPFIEWTGTEGMGVPPPHPFRRPHSIEMKPSRNAAETKRSNDPDDSGMRPLVIGVTGRYAAHESKFAQSGGASGKARHRAAFCPASSPAKS